MCRIIAVTTNKGGVAKTTTTTSLASVFAAQGQKVLIIDTDNQGNAAVSFGIKPRAFQDTLYDVLVTKGFNPRHAIYNLYDIAKTKHEALKNLDIMPSNHDMTYLEIDVLKDVKKYENPLNLLKGPLDLIKKDYDIIIIDTPPNLGMVNANVMLNATDLVIPFQPDDFNVEAVKEMLDHVFYYKKNYGADINILGILPTLVNANTNLHKKKMIECRIFAEKNNIPMFDVYVPLSIKFSTAIAEEKIPAVLSEKGSKHTAVKTYYEVAEEIKQKGAILNG